MTRRPQNPAFESEDDPTLTIGPESVCWVILKAREFHVKDAPTISDPGSNPSDDKMISVLEDRANDPVEHELKVFISSLSEDEQIDLVALSWLGRDDNTLEDWPTLRQEAARVGASQRAHTADYLLGMPLLSDYLEEALSLFGFSCEDFELNRL